jgi:ATP-dependent helicase IRC3
MTTETRPTLALRPYQEEAIEAINGASQEDIRRPLVALPTGTGKTVVFAHLIDQMPGRSLVLAHRDELIRQSVDKLLTVNPTMDIGVVKAGENETGAPVVVASVQTLSRPNRLAQVGHDFPLVIVDEGHHAVADTYMRTLEHLGCFESDGPLTCGFTATPERGDKAGLGKVWQKIIFQKSLLEMILAGYLCDLRTVRVTLRTDLDQVHTRHGDFIDSELESALLNADAPKHVAAAYQEHAPNRKALVFTPTVRMAYAMAEAFQEAGVAAEALDGTTPMDERREILQRLHTGETMVLCNCAVLTEGFDCPSVDCIVVARPTKIKPLYIQMVGRGTRTYPGKDDCLILDVVGVTSRHSIMTASEIFKLDLKAKLVKEAVEERERRAALPQEEPRYVDGKLAARDVALFRVRPMHWVKTDRGAWALGLGNGSVRLVPTEGDRWDVIHVERGREMVLWIGLPLGYAMGAAEDYAREQGAGGLLNPKARWRREPASPKQINWLRWRGRMVPDGLTKGQASDIMTAMGR